MSVSNIGGSPAGLSAFPDNSFNGAFPNATPESPIPMADTMTPQSQNASGLYTGAQMPGL